jgi:hypothetical protein
MWRASLEIQRIGVRKCRKESCVRTRFGCPSSLHMRHDHSVASGCQWRGVDVGLDTIGAFVEQNCRRAIGGSGLGVSNVETRIDLLDWPR